MNAYLAPQSDDGGCNTRPLLAVLVAALGLLCAACPLIRLPYGDRGIAWFDWLGWFCATPLGSCRTGESWGVDFWAKALQMKGVGALRRLTPRVVRDDGGGDVARDAAERSELRIRPNPMTSLTRPPVLRARA